jgi:hypothetical protein
MAEAFDLIEVEGVVASNPMIIFRTAPWRRGAAVAPVAGEGCGRSNDAT